MTRRIAASAALLLFLTTPRLTLCSPIRIRVVDPTGAPIPNVLVILKSLDGQGEQFRALSGADGFVASVQGLPGLYQAIATSPYSYWKTAIKEFLVGNKPVLVELRVESLPTHGYGDKVVVGTRINLTLLGSDGNPLPKTWIYVRDPLARLDLSVTTDAFGKATFELIGDPTVLIIVHDGRLQKEEISRRDVNCASSATGKCEAPWTIHVQGRSE